MEMPLTLIRLARATVLIAGAWTASVLPGPAAETAGGRESAVDKSFHAALDKVDVHRQADSQTTKQAPQ